MLSQKLETPVKLRAPTVPGKIWNLRQIFSSEKVKQLEGTLPDNAIKIVLLLANETIAAGFEWTRASYSFIQNEIGITRKTISKLLGRLIRMCLVIPDPTNRPGSNIGYGYKINLAWQAWGFSWDEAPKVKRAADDYFSMLAKLPPEVQKEAKTFQILKTSLQQVVAKEHNIPYHRIASSIHKEEIRIRIGVEDEEFSSTSYEVSENKNKEIKKDTRMVPPNIKEGGISSNTLRITKASTVETTSKPPSLFDLEKKRNKKGDFEEKDLRMRELSDAGHFKLPPVTGIGDDACTCSYREICHTCIEEAGLISDDF